MRAFNRGSKSDDVGNENNNTIYGQHSSYKKPYRQSMFFIHKNSFYQNIICKIIKTTNTITAQKMGRFIKGRCPSEGNSVQPLTSPTNCSTGLGFVAKLTNTVTSTQMIHDHKARYMSSAIAFASAEPVM